jgi:poly(A) polymerase/tRNA nucleotidyltransferase (CCA-adding enzyme)
MNTNLQSKIPGNILWTIKHLQDSGFEAFVVGGCVRDMFLDKNPNDWDITTNAIPQEIIDAFEKTDRRVVYENIFGTVGIINKNLDLSDVGYEIEITPYRTESGYSDNRRPDEILFSNSIHEDVKRRDFTINAMAYDPILDVLIDDFDGKGDIEKRILRTVGNPLERFSEDALRLMRMVRFSAQLGFIGETDTINALHDLAPSLKNISSERIRDEFIKIVDAPFAKEGMEMMRVHGLLEYTIAELLQGVGCEQGGIHSFDVWTHLIKSLEHGSKKQYPFHVKFAALFHDIGKPRSRRAANGRGTKEWTFYGHEVIGARMTKDIMKRLKFSKELTEKVVKLVRYHMFFSDPEAITLSAVRRMVANVGEDMIWELTDLRTCDRIGTGRPSEKPYRLRKYEAMIEEVLRDPISVGMLKINGDIMIREMRLQPGRKMGWILHALLEEVLDEPIKNTREYLESRALEMYTMTEKDLQKIGEAGREKKNQVDTAEIKKLHKKHKV